MIATHFLSSHYITKNCATRRGGAKQSLPKDSKDRSSRPKDESETDKWTKQTKCTTASFSIVLEGTQETNWMQGVVGSIKRFHLCSFSGSAFKILPSPCSALRHPTLVWVHRMYKLLDEKKVKRKSYKALLKSSISPHSKNNVSCSLLGSGTKTFYRLGYLVRINQQIILQKVLLKQHSGLFHAFRNPFAYLSRTDTKM